MKGLYTFLSLIFVALIPLTANSQSNDMHVLPGTKITIEDGSTMTFTACKLILHSPENSGPTASLIDKGATNDRQVYALGGGTIIAERFLSRSETHYVAAPLTDALSAALTPDNAGYYIHDEAAVWGKESSWVKSKSDDNPLNSGQGYAAGYTLPYMVKFTGTELTTGDKTISVQYTDNGDDENHYGWNLIGNPYPSAIDWDDVEADWNNQTSNTEDIYSAIYFWDKDNYRYYVPGSDDQSGSFTEPPAYTQDATSIIPPMQGFFVKAKSGATEITIPNSARVHNTTEIFHKKKRQKNSNSLRVAVSNDSNTDEAFLRFLDNATSNFDGNYDAYKMLTDENYPDVPQIYSITPDATKLAINSLPINETEDLIVPLGFKTEKAGTFTIQISDFNFEENVPVYLEDTYGSERGEAVNEQLQSGSQYSFTSDKGTFNDRFILHFAPMAVDVPEIKGQESAYGINVYANSNKIYVRIPTEKARVTVYNMLGSVVLDKNLTSNFNIIPLQKTKGQYIVKVNDGSEIKTTKVYLK